MNKTSAISYESWLAELARIAKQEELGWAISVDSDIHRPAFDKGLTPAEELAALKDSAEWRGCGCGGGG